jgi:hypothetical protein
MKAKPLTHDPILCDFELPLRAVYCPLGFALEVLTNSRAVLAAAQESWGMLRRHFDCPPVRLCVGVLEGNLTEIPPAPVVRGRRHLMTLTADVENFAVLDLRDGFGYCWLNRAVVENTAYLRYHFLESTGPTLVEYLYATPLHAACVEFDGCGFLLCGESGAGKSSLAYACARRGWTFLSDDASAIVRRRKGRVVIGNPYKMRFRESAAILFPELRDRPITARATGKLAIEVATSTLPEIKTARETEVDYIVFLDRHSFGLPWVSALPLSEARKSFERVICYGEEENREAQRSALDNLLTAATLELHYNDLDSAVDQLESLVKYQVAPQRSSFLIL